ncbi:hypothetical protein ACLOJK_008792 [Asimina triloba]
MGGWQNKLSLLFFLWVVAFSGQSVGIPSEFSILGYDPTEAILEHRVVEIFEQWRDMYRKAYASLEEKEKRFQVFRKNLEYVIDRSHKKGPLGHAVGLNKFADLSNAEFKETYLSKIMKPLKRRKTVEDKETSCEAPSSLDWRKRGVVTGVKNQGSCGSCWAFSSTGAMEGINAIATGDLISLSEQELVDCDSTNEGCDGGYMDYAFEWVIQNEGIDSESNYPYTGQDGTCNIQKEETKVVTIDGYEDVAQTDSALLCAVVKQPISVGIDGSSIDFQLYTGGIYDGDCSSNPDDIDHAVLVVGYASQGSIDYWIVKNSWGTDWGIDGYIYIERNTNLEYGVCAINAMASYPTKESVSPSPFPSPAVPPPPPPPPPPPGPSPVQCGDLSYCASGETCCCIFEFAGTCFIYGCCEYENAVCCTGTIYCCPQDYPICDIPDGLCLQSYGDSVGVAPKKRKFAKHKFPWTKCEKTPKTYQPQLAWKRDRLAAIQ